MNTLRLYRPTTLVEIIHGRKVMTSEYAIHSSSRKKRYALITTWYTCEEEKALGHKYIQYIHFFDNMDDLVAEQSKIVNRKYGN